MQQELVDKNIKDDRSSPLELVIEQEYSPPPAPIDQILKGVVVPNDHNSLQLRKLKILEKVSEDALYINFTGRSLFSEEGVIQVTAAELKYARNKINSAQRIVNKQIEALKAEIKLREPLEDMTSERKFVDNLQGLLSSYQKFSESLKERISNQNLPIKKDFESSKYLGEFEVDQKTLEVVLAALNIDVDLTNFGKKDFQALKKQLKEVLPKDLTLEQKVDKIANKSTSLMIAIENSLTVVKGVAGAGIGVGAIAAAIAVLQYVAFFELPLIYQVKIVAMFLFGSALIGAQFKKGKVLKETPKQYYIGSFLDFFTSDEFREVVPRLSEQKQLGDASTSLLRKK